MLWLRASTAFDAAFGVAAAFSAAFTFARFGV